MDLSSYENLIGFTCVKIVLSEKRIQIWDLIFNCIESVRFLDGVYRVLDE